jgi:cysteine sulfinate desulfinase/cysteine desulfurase-like protein
MTVNNEIGVVQPMEEIGKLCRSKKIFFHTDAAQAVGKIPIDVNKMNIDLMSISGHKIYGPKGIGACYVRRRPRVRLDPIISGGGQERGLRSGTLAPPLAIGMGEAARICREEMEVRTHPFIYFHYHYDYLLYICMAFIALGGPRSSTRHGDTCRDYESLFLLLWFIISGHGYR